MSAAAALPTARDEAWRYADHAAVAKLWPLPAPEKITVNADAPLNRTLVIYDGGIRQLTLLVEADAKAAFSLFNLGGGYGRLELDVTLMAGADFTLDAAQIGTAEQVLEIITTVTHAGPGARSRQVVRMVADGQASVTYLGKVRVLPDAQQTDAAQSSRALLLSRAASVNTKPELEIHADDVRCAHGATVGELDRQALFYLATRGIAPDEARALLIESFMADVIASVPDSALRDQLTGSISNRLHAMVSS